MWKFILPLTVASACAAAGTKSESPVCIVQQAIAINKMAPKDRGEYETVDAFTARQKKEQDRLEADKRCGPPVKDGFRVVTAATRSYSIDTNTLTIKLTDAIDSGYCGITAAEKSKVIRRYTAQNSFGAKVNVTHSIVLRYMIANDEFGHGTSCLLSSAQAEVKMPPEEAKRHPKITALLHGRLRPAYFARNEDYTSPTIDSPLEVNERTEIALTDWRSITFVNSSTGEVITTIDWTGEK